MKGMQLDFGLLNLFSPPKCGSVHIRQDWPMVPKGFIGRQNPLFRRGNERGFPVVHAYQNCLLLKPRCTLITWFEGLGNINGLAHCMLECHSGSHQVTGERTTVLPKVKRGYSSISTPSMLWCLRSSLHLKAHGFL